MLASSSSLVAARRRFASLVTLATLVAVASCKLTSVDDVADGAPAADADAGDSGRCGADSAPTLRPFDPTGYDRACTVDSDCIVIGAITPLADPAYPGLCDLSCCGGYAVRATAQVSADRATANAACCSYVSCTRGCMDSRAVCDHGTCRFVDPVTAPLPDAGSEAEAGDAGTD